MLLSISLKGINTIWLILSVPKGKSSIILVSQQGIMKKKERLTCQTLHPESMAEPVRASDDYTVIASE